jgi:hypothetical protein
MFWTPPSNRSILEKISLGDDLQEGQPSMSTPLIVFDVNETLLDRQTIEPIFERIFADGSAHSGWPPGGERSTAASGDGAAVHTGAGSSDAGAVVWAIRT